MCACVCWCPLPDGLCPWTSMFAGKVRLMLCARVLSMTLDVVVKYTSARNTDHYSPLPPSPPPSTIQYGQDAAGILHMDCDHVRSPWTVSIVPLHCFTNQCSTIVQALVCELEPPPPRPSQARRLYGLSRGINTCTASAQQWSRPMVLLSSSLFVTSTRLVVHSQHRVSV